VGAEETDLLGSLFDTARCNPSETLSEQFSATGITHRSLAKASTCFIRHQIQFRQQKRGTAYI